MNRLSLLFPLFLLFACGREDAASTSAQCFQLPAGTHLPRLSQSKSELWLSYVNSSESGTDTLAIYALNGNRWMGPDLEIYGEDWFINWADFPSMVPVDSFMESSYYFYHWLQYSGEGTYDYDIMYNTQFPTSYSIPGKLHQDTTRSEHGFLSSAILPNGDLQVSWLDGRYTKESGADAGAGEEHGHGHGSGAMTLRTMAIMWSDTASVELDHRVCDCCNTATVATDSLIMVAYRDRSEHEIRDISYVTKSISGNEWSTPKLVHADNWEISGCPVNGPALAANGAGNIAVVWYTAPADRAQIMFSRYDAANDRFQSPVLLDDNSPLGRVDIQLAEDGTAYVTGLTTKSATEDAFLTLWTISPDNKIKQEDLTASSAARSAGFPKIALFRGKLYWARTVLGEEKGAQFVEICSK